MHGKPIFSIVEWLISKTTPHPSVSPMHPVYNFNRYRSLPFTGEEAEGRRRSGEVGNPPTRQCMMLMCTCIPLSCGLTISFPFYALRFMILRSVLQVLLNQQLNGSFQKPPLTPQSHPCMHPVYNFTRYRFLPFTGEEAEGRRRSGEVGNPPTRLCMLTGMIYYNSSLIPRPYAVNGSFQKPPLAFQSHPCTLCAPSPDTSLPFTGEEAEGRRRRGEVGNPKR